MMDYDMRSQIFGPCIASANSPPYLVLQGLANFTKLGIPHDKLVLGCVLFISLSFLYSHLPGYHGTVMVSHTLYLIGPFVQFQFIVNVFI
jgi:hypothetical protein